MQSANRRHSHAFLAADIKAMKKSPVIVVSGIEYVKRLRYYQTKEEIFCLQWLSYTSKTSITTTDPAITVDENINERNTSECNCRMSTQPCFEKSSIKV
ncbi:hypothetical protein PoB_003609400 [Plakobranchus ocellatus]|uniref:Uncharacterized protein n=1 Tax=Plakobranchus ocellatus TaxID=259542 RepID=A0AAV4AP67_9GAST|nr:hypothetical protein PoB_003609400 [Plakobranchus ocellatus]